MSNNSPVRIGLDIMIIETPRNVQVVGLDHTHLFDTIDEAERFIISDALANESADAGGKCWFVTHEQPADIWEHEFDEHPTLDAETVGCDRYHEQRDEPELFAGRWS